jgi:hypothetical protein
VRQQGHRSRGWCHSNRGCSGITSIVVILIIGVFSHAVKSSLLGLLFLQLLNIFPQLLAQGFQLYDLLA